MNKSLLSLKKTLLTLMLVASGSALMAQQPNLSLTVFVKSSTTGLPIVSKNVKAVRTFPPDSTTTQYQQNNGNGASQFTLPYFSTTPELNIWTISTGWVGQTPVYDTVAFSTSLSSTQVKTLYLADSVPALNCDPVFTASLDPGTMLWTFTADTTGFRACHGYGYLQYGLTIDNQLVDTNFVYHNGWGNNPNVFTVPITTNGIHTICIQVLGTNSPNVPQSCLTITVGGPPQNFISGKILADGYLYEGSTMVELFGVSQGQLIVRTDTLQWPMDSSWYYFGSVPFGQYYVRATPLDPYYISTYSRSSLTWEDANVIQMPGLTMPPFEYHDVDLISFWDSSTIANGTVQGLVSGIGINVTNNLPGGGNVTSTFTAGRANVFVKDAQGHVVGHATLNPDGTFFMEDLPEGNYTLVIDHPFVDASTYPVNFTATNNVVNVQATVTSTGLNMVTGNKTALQNAGINLFPNPAQNRVFIQNFEKIKNLTLVNVLGVSTPVIPSASLTLDNKAPGIYFLQGQTTDGERFNLRLIKQ